MIEIIGFYLIRESSQMLLPTKIKSIPFCYLFLKNELLILLRGEIKDNFVRYQP